MAGCVELVGEAVYKGETVKLLRVRGCDFDAIVRDFEELESRLGFASGYCIVSESKPGLAYVAHELHPTRFVAVYDETLGECVVVQSHTPGVRVGDKLPIHL